MDSNIYPGMGLQRRAKLSRAASLPSRAYVALTAATPAAPQSPVHHEDLRPRRPRRYCRHCQRLFLRPREGRSSIDRHLHGVPRVV